MPDNENLPPASEITPAPIAPVPLEKTESTLRRIFIGPNGLRAGWRLAIYILLVFVFSYLVRVFHHHFFPSKPHAADAPMEPVAGTISRTLGFLCLSVAALIMARFEKAKWDDYGLPLRRILSFDFWFGCFWGIAGLSIVMGSLWLAGAYRIEGLALAGMAIWKYAVLWGIMFYVVGLLEEFSMRGYTQYTLASGVGFWPAAIIFSAVFLAGHIGNSGENWMGLADVFLIGLFLCFTLWRTGDLWFAVGLHAAWDWGLTYLYSVPNSGTTATGHLLNVHTQGPNWLTGGSAGPEGSIINLIFDLLCFVIFAMFYKKRKWIGMDDRHRAREASADSKPLLDPSALSS